MRTKEQMVIVTKEHLYEPTARTEPIVHPEYPKCVGTHIWEISEGVFDFSDETENLAGGNFTSIETAQAALDAYCYWLNKE